MKLVFATLLVLASINAFAKQQPASKPCKLAVQLNASKIKSDAKDIVRATEDQLDAGLDRDGDPTVGMGARGNAQGAQSIVDAVRDLQTNGVNAVLSDSTNEWLNQLCTNNLSVGQAIENY